MAVKKSFGVFVYLLLAGCTGTQMTVQEGPTEGTKYPLQDTAPMPWVRVVPSDRALDMKEVDFNVVAHQIRNDLNYDPHHKLFENVKLVLVDYTILPHEDHTKKISQREEYISPSKGSDHESKASSKKKGPSEEALEEIKMERNGATYSPKNESRPQRYMLSISFYESDTFPPGECFREETIFMEAKKAPPQEAIRTMIHNLIEDIHAAPPSLKKIVVSLD